MGWRDFKFNDDIRTNPCNRISDQWGSHAPLVEWFLKVEHTLPRKPLLYDHGERWTVWWMDPATGYQKLAEEIMKNPGGKWAPEVRSILEQLYALFGDK